MNNKYRFSCSTCYQRKKKCDRNSPCSHCLRHNIDCTPSSIETTERPLRKRRFPEAELLGRIRKYEAALIAYGADLETIRNSSDAIIKSKKESQTGDTCNSAPDQVAAAFLTTLDGEVEGIESSHQPGQSWYDRVFTDDASSTLFAVEPVEVPSHPSPFDIFKLWQVYCDNIHPINKTLHAPSFQRKISTYGSHLHLAPAADQALFFAVYMTATTSLSSRDCEAMFFTRKEVMLEQYKIATQVWLRRAGVWRTSELAVLQALILFLSSLLNIVDPRIVASFTAVADRIARRMGLHRNSRQGDTTRQLLEQEMRIRVWWELVLLDAKAVERAGMGASVPPSCNSSAPSPSERSDADLEYLNKNSPPLPLLQPSSEMICFQIRVEAVSFIGKLHQHAPLRPEGKKISLSSTLDRIDGFEKHLQSCYLRFCDQSLPHHRLTTLFARASLSKLRMSAYIVVGSSESSDSLQLLQHCSENLVVYSQMRGDETLKPFKWFILQNLPIFSYIQLLRLLQNHFSGAIVDRAWQGLETFKSTTTDDRPVADSLILKAWMARKEATSGCSKDPTFITEILHRASVNSMSHLSTDLSSDVPLSESEMTSLFAEFMSGEAYDQLNWSI